MKDKKSKRNYKNTLYTDEYLTKRELDNLVDSYIKEESYEKLWRLILKYSNSILDFTKIIDFYIEKKNSYYLIETIYCLGQKCDIKRIYDSVKKTNDKSFIRNFQEELMTYSVTNSIDELEEYLSKY